MAVTPFTATTTVGSSATLVNLQRKVQGKVLHLVVKTSAEFAYAKTLKDAGFDFSGREVTQPAQLEERGGGAFIPDGGYEADPRSIAPRELTYTFSEYNDRVSLTRFAKIQDAKNRAAMLESQVKFQTMQMAQGTTRRFAQTFWGLSAGTVCQTSTNATSATQTLTLINAWAQTEAAADNAAYLAQQFLVNDRIFVWRTSTAYIANGFGTITAVTAATPSIAVTMVGSADVDANDYIGFAQSVQNDATTLDSGDLNKWPVGLIDAIETTTVHGLSGSTVPQWAAAGNDATGGRFNGTKLMLGQDTIENRGGKGPYTFFMSQGIKRDIFNQQVAAVRFQDPMTMRLDGAVKVGEGVTPFVSKWNPPGRAIMMPTGAMKKWLLTEMPDENGELPDYGDQGQVDKVADRAAFVIGVDLVYGFIHQRQYYHQWKNLTES
jgi:hypothetical protein